MSSSQSGEFSTSQGLEATGPGGGVSTSPSNGQCGPAAHHRPRKEGTGPEEAKTDRARGASRRPQSTSLGAGSRAHREAEPRIHRRACPRPPGAPVLADRRGAETPQHFPHTARSQAGSPAPCGDGGRTPRCRGGPHTSRGRRGGSPAGDKTDTPTDPEPDHGRGASAASGSATS